MSLTQVIFLKELRETLRDKRVILGVIVSPLLLTPCLMGAVIFFGSKKAVEQQTATLEVGIYQEAEFPELTDFIETNESIEVSRYQSRDESIDAIKSFQSRAVVVIPPTARSSFQSQGTAPIEILYDQANENSGNAHGRLRGVLNEFNKQQIKSRLASADLDESFIQPTQINSTSIAEDTAVSGFVLSIFLPYIVIMGAAFGGLNTAFDLCAGEKERGTMETLLVSPASRNDIVRGKLYTIFVVSLLSAICSILGIVAAISFGQQIVSSLFGESFSLSYVNLAALVAIVVPLALLSSAALLLVSTFARNPKEAQAYIFPFIVIFLFPAALSFVFDAESPLYVGFIPVLNIALSMKQLLSDAFDLPFFTVTLASSLAYAWLSIRLVASFFQRESILFRS
ncbi:ABC transporter permease [Pelagicoccus sp. SDUM812002]|uniref:ABC transporter permease n=1 Tax=Pelagicoccus sp. SDUM812002 TaxID=3041266 RepID=UPI00280E90D6|nr:ABC transporter permease [Pelagicoccus sp. SDUM812002]MDQ8186609.1 ABC transporter permease [Pelagicoccus sp. SDUM812002]